MEGSMYRLIIIFILIPIFAQAQENYNSRYVEFNTYKMYSDSSWKELIKEGKKAFKNDIDYAYLRARVGVAYFKLKKYRLAKQQFLKVRKFDSNNELSNEFLYYCYIFNEEYEQSRRLSSIFHQELRIRTQTAHIPAIPLFFIEGGSKASTNSELFGNAAYFQFGINHRLGRKASMSEAYTYYTQNSYRGKLSQNQYYANMLLPIGKTSLLTLGIHGIKFLVETQLPPPPFGNLKPPPPIIQTQFNYVFAISYRKSFNYLNITPGIAISNLDLTSQKQGSLDLQIFPLGNNRLSLGGEGIYQIANNSGNYAYRLNFNYQIRNRLKLYMAYYKGYILNYNEETGYYVNNNYFYTNSKISFIPELMLSKKVSMYMILQKENKSSDRAGKNEQFHYNNIFLGLKLKSF